VGYLAEEQEDPIKNWISGHPSLENSKTFRLNCTKYLNYVEILL
jgi:hypothetical protein